MASGSILAVIFVLGAAACAEAQVKYATGQNVVPVYEGWERNTDGTFNLVFGYMNRNYQEEMDIPIGPNNTIEPGGADRGQPTHFYTRRQEFAFKVKVPADWGEKELVWTLVSAGKAEKAYGGITPVWELGSSVYQQNRGGPLDPYGEANHAPTIEMVGPAQKTVAVGEPLTLSVEVADDGLPSTRGRRPGGGAFAAAGRRPNAGVPARNDGPIAQAVVKLDPGARLGVTWVVYRGSGSVTFDPMRVAVVSGESSGAASGKAATKVTFAQAGTYVLRAYADDGVLLTPIDVTVTVR